jgi:hypothetical protein
MSYTTSNLKGCYQHLSAVMKVRSRNTRGFEAQYWARLAESVDLLDKQETISSIFKNFPEAGASASFIAQGCV